jgi:hypothetical protein
MAGRAEDIRTLYPYPIAFPFAAMESAVRNPPLQLQLLVSTAEYLIKFVANALLSEYVDLADTDPAVDELIRKRLWKTSLTFGEWAELATQLSRQLTGVAHRLLLPGLCRPLTRGDVTGKLERLLKLRNEHSHGMWPDTATCATLVATHREPLLSLLHDFRVLTTAVLAVPFERTEDRVVSYFACTGESSQFRFVERADIPIAKRDQPFVIKDLALLLLSTADPRASRCLLPFCVFQVEPEVDVYLFEKLEMQSGTVPVAKRIEYRSTQRGRPALRIERKVTSPDVIAAFDRVLDKIGMKGSDVPSLNAGKPEFGWASTKDIIAIALQHFIDRPELTAAFEKFRLDNTRGCFLILGGPGAGKTTVAAHFSRTFGYTHHFIRTTENRSEPKLFLRALLGQLQERYGLPWDLEGDEQQLFEKLGGALRAAAAESRQRDEPVCLLIDGLDELADGSPVRNRWLPVDLPVGVYLIITSRPSSAADDLLTKATPCAVWEILPFDEPASRQYFEAASEGRSVSLGEDDWAALFSATMGNPLFLRVLASEFRRTGDFSMASIPAALENVFDSALARANALADGIPRRLLAALAVSGRELAGEELARILQVEVRFVAEVLKSIQTLLLRDSEGRYRLFHKKLKDHLLHTVLLPSDVQLAHRMIADYCQPWREKRLRYGDEFLPLHLLAVGAVAEFMDLAEAEQPEVVESVVLALVQRVIQDHSLINVQLQLESLLASKHPAAARTAARSLDALVPYGHSASVARLIEPYAATVEVRAPGAAIELLLTQARALDESWDGDSEMVAAPIRRALALTRSGGHRELEARGRCQLAEVLLYRQGRLQEAMEQATLAVAHAAESGNLDTQVRACGVLARAFSYSGAVSEALDVAETLERLSIERKSPINSIEALLARAEALFRASDLAEASGLARAAVRAAVEAGLNQLHIQALVLLADIDREAGALAAARSGYERVLALMKDAGSAGHEISALWGLAYLAYYHDDDSTRCLSLVQHLRHAAITIGDPYMATCADQLEGERAADQRLDEEAISRYLIEENACLNEFDRGRPGLPADPYLVLAWAEMARLQVRLARYAEARALLAKAKQLQGATETERFRVRLLCAEAEIMANESGPAAALQFLSEAVNAKVARESTVESLRLRMTRAWICCEYRVDGFRKEGQDFIRDTSAHGLKAWSRLCRDWLRRIDN